jgi:hypothetical protein
MLTKIITVASIVLLLVAVLWLPTVGYQIMLETVVCMASLLVLTQTVQRAKYFWAMPFFVIAVLFNPIVPIVLARKTFLWLDLVCLMTFTFSLAGMAAKPRLSIPSITNRTPGSESL